MKNPDKFLTLAKKLGISPEMLEQYMASKNAETKVDIRLQPNQPKARPLYTN